MLESAWFMFSSGKFWISKEKRNSVLHFMKTRSFSWCQPGLTWKVWWRDLVFIKWRTCKCCLNPNWHELRKQEKCSSLAQPRSKFYKTQWAWQGVKLSRLISIFTSKNVWKFLIKFQLTKSNPKIIMEVNPPCLMPIRVKSQKDKSK